jgi:hypothetical protein
MVQTSANLPGTGCHHVNPKKMTTQDGLLRQDDKRQGPQQMTLLTSG